MRVFFSNRAQFPSPPLTKHRLTNRKEAGAVYTPVGHYDFSFLPPPIRVINIVADPWQLSCLVFSLSLSLSATRPFRHDTVTTREHKVSSQFHASPPRPFFPLPAFEWPEIRDCIILLMSTARWLKNDDTRSVPVASRPRCWRITFVVAVLVSTSCLFLDKIFFFFCSRRCNSVPPTMMENFVSDLLVVKGSCI